jgi:hypothetical protein
MKVATALARALILALPFASAFTELGSAKSNPKAGPPLATLTCPKGNVFFTHLPTQLAALSAVVPLGNVNPPSHTLPSRHIYAYPKMTTSGDLSTAITVPVRAPSRLEIVAVKFHPVSLDWDLYLKPCKDILLYFFHVQTLAPKIAAAVGNVTNGGVTFPDFTAKLVSIMVTPGQLLGQAKTFDIGVEDFRKAPQPCLP